VVTVRSRRRHDGRPQVVVSQEAAVPFVSGQPVVREVDNDVDWKVAEPIIYQGRDERFVVNDDFVTDFASTPRVVTWLIPPYGRYTRPAILHDWLCQQAREGRISRVDADGLFRRSMRELGVAFLKRRLMWAAVRAQSVKDAGWAQLFQPWTSFLALIALGLFAVLVLALPVLVILVALVVFHLAEWVAYPFVSQAGRRAEPDRPAVRPRFTWRV
jgi:hypothetical protein